MSAPSSPPTPDPLAGIRLSQAVAFALVRAERAYQDRKWGDIDAHPHEVGAWLLVMKGKLDAAVTAWQTTAGSDVPALWNVIKAIAVGVACLEQHGAELLVKAIADMEFTKTQQHYMTPSRRCEAYWPILERIRECMDQSKKENAADAAPQGG